MRFVPAPVLFAFVCTALLAPLAAQNSAPASLRVILAFKNAKPGYFDGSWTTETIQRSPQGLFIMGDANGAGKLGQAGFSWDVSQDKYLELAVASGPSNQVAGIGFVLADADGTEVRWALPLTDLEPKKPKAMKLEFETAIATAVTGATPGFDRTKVAMWRIEGDGVAETPVQLVFIHLQAAR